MRVCGTLYDSYSSKGRSAVLVLDSDEFYAELTDAGTVENFEFERVEDKLPGVPRRIFFKSARSFVPSGDLPSEIENYFDGSGSRFLLWLEKFSFSKSLTLFATCLLFFIGARVALPVLADSMAMRVPQRIESKIGKSAFENLDYVEFEPSALEPERIARLKNQAMKMAVAAGFEPPPEIYFRKSKYFGANAFALPGGPVVITDELVKHLGSDDLTVAVIAHEYAHIKARHGIKNFLHTAGFFTVAAIFFGANETVLEEIAVAGIALSNLDYGRRQEIEADTIGAAILSDAGFDPGNMAKALKSLKSIRCGEENGEENCAEIPQWLSTHPSIDERIGNPDLTE